MRRSLLIVFIAVLALGGCKTAAEHHDSLPSTKEKEMTVGTVQREIRQGMTQTQVAEVMGSPNIVTSDGPGQETWIYDKVSTDTAYSKSSGGVQSLFLAQGGDVGGGLAPSYKESSGAATRTQRTLTVIIKFEGGKVYDFSYHSSKF
ncbi:MAG: outer membrane protein assembly factor BamE [Nitrospirota bacterium]|nr:MAG: outer membrane protein assembly factor BamE [Nitrospirota bacterium]